MGYDDKSKWMDLSLLCYNYILLKEMLRYFFSIEKGSNFSWNKISKKVAKIYKRMNAAAMSPQQSCSVKQDV